MPVRFGGFCGLWRTSGSKGVKRAFRQQGCVQRKTLIHSCSAFLGDRRRMLDVSLAAALAERYKVERELGAGGMASIYLAHDVRHDRDVAIKVLHPDLAA